MTDRRPPMAMRPGGPLGRSFAKIMQRMNRSAYTETLKALRPEPGHALLEIGFGTGAFLQLAAKQMGAGLLAGVDPSSLMLDMATAKLKTLPTDLQTDLRLGDDTGLDWPEQTFNRIAAIHSFQFWTDPEASIKRLRQLLKPGGVLCLCLRSHGTPPPDWLPNEISKQADEADRVIALLQALGFTEASCGAGSSHWQIVSATAA